MDDALLWAVRTAVYRQFAETARPPSPEEAAAACDCSREQAALAYQALHHRHALFLDPESPVPAIRMANPFSAVPTAFRVHARGRAYWANCAWDGLGIPAALHCDAHIETADPENGDRITLQVQDGNVRAHGEVIHFLLPFRRWYVDLVYT